MANNDIQIGEVTYQLSRVFIGSRAAADLVIDRLVNQAKENANIDASEKPAV